MGRHRRHRANSADHVSWSNDDPNLARWQAGTTAMQFSEEAMAALRPFLADLTV
jgi:hypothetical protein